MKKYIYKISAFISAAIFLFYAAGCAEDITPTLTEYSPPSLPTPVITSINPPTEALAGVTKIIISGSNFSSTLRNNLVYFNGVPGTVISATPTQLELTSPVVISDSVSIKIAIIGSDQFSNVISYKLKAAVAEFYAFNPKIFEVPYAITLDNLENMFVSLKDLGIKKISNQGVMTSFAPKGPETFFRSITLASDNVIYAVRGGIKGVYKVAENTAPSAFVASAQGITDNVNSINFDESRNVLWAGGNTGIIYRITLAKNVKKFNVSGTINAVRVAGNNLFVAATTDKEVIWKIPIVSADSLGTPELYFDFSTQINNLLKIIDLVIAQDGDLCIGTDKTTDPVYIIHPDKSSEVLYPGLINSAAYSLVWGNGNFMYMTNIVNGTNTTVLKIDMQKLGL
ncbi:MAG: IPT/TIG domain-containing protein [Ignavibacteriaceae bacterium]|nr:IPT/TIG domain-containing protein [Ignavibacteriaceae bacterium]